VHPVGGHERLRQRVGHAVGGRSATLQADNRPGARDDGFARGPAAYRRVFAAQFL
jgi:hypothetical protein